MPNMLERAILSASLVLVAGACSKPEDTVQTLASELVTVAVGPRPESITKAWGGKFYVSIQGPSGALGVFDGEVRQIDIQTGVVTPFVTGLENPRGLAFTGEFLRVQGEARASAADDAAADRGEGDLGAVLLLPASVFAAAPRAHVRAEEKERHDEQE